MGLVVKDYITDEQFEDLRSFGFLNNGCTYYKTYGEYFEVILNPIINLGESGLGQVVINYLNEDVDIEEDDYIDEHYDMTEIYYDIALLIDTGIIVKE